MQVDNLSRRALVYKLALAVATPHGALVWCSRAPWARWTRGLPSCARARHVFAPRALDSAPRAAQVHAHVVRYSTSTARRRNRASIDSIVWRGTAQATTLGRRKTRGYRLPSPEAQEEGTRTTSRQDGSAGPRRPRPKRLRNRRQKTSDPTCLEMTSLDIIHWSMYTNDTLRSGLALDPRQ